jgi:hypothetical protein
MQSVFGTTWRFVGLRGIGSLAAAACVGVAWTAADPSPPQAHAAPQDSVALHRSAIAAIDAFEDLAEAHYVSPTTGPCEYGPHGCEGIRCVAVTGAAPCFMGRRMPCYPGSAWPDFIDCQGTPESLAHDSARLVNARNALLAQLDSIGGRLPGDSLVTGQRIHYLVDAGDLVGAVRVATACRPTRDSRAWCLELQAYAHARNREPVVAEALFDTLLAADPDVRCRLGDPSRLFDESNMQHDAPPCKSAKRAPLENRLWWLSDPSWLVPGNDRRVEHLARKVEVDLMYQWIVAKCAFAPRFLDRLFHNKLCFESAATLGHADSVHVVRYGPSDSWYAHVEIFSSADSAGRGRGAPPPPPSGADPTPPRSGRGRRLPPPPITPPTSTPIVRSESVNPDYCETIWPLSTEARFHFVPEQSAIDAPLSARATDWDLTAGHYGFPAPQMLRYCDDEHWRFRPERYTPPYAAVATQLREWQVAYFRRGDSAELVGAADVSHDTLFARLLAPGHPDARDWTAGVFAFAHVLPSGLPRDSASTRVSMAPRPQWRLAVRAPWDSLLFGLEVLVPQSVLVDSARSAGGALGRVRFGITPPTEPKQRVQLSDVLLYDTDGPVADHLDGPDGALPRALGSTDLRTRAKVGLFWEVYGMVPGEVADVLITVVPEDIDHAVIDGIFRAIARTHEPSVTLSYQDHAPASADTAVLAAGWGRGLSLDVGTLAAGSYSVHVTVRVPGQQPVSVSRAFSVHPTPK